MPKPGPPVVSIWTTRETPSALGLLQAIGAALGMGVGAGDWAAGFAGPAWAVVADCWAGPAATRVVPAGAACEPDVGVASSVTTLRGPCGRTGSARGAAGGALCAGRGGGD